MPKVKPKLYAHQSENVQKIRSEKRLLVADEPGLGKTRSVIEALDGLRVLVVAPAMVVDSGEWESQIARWSNHPGNYTVVSYHKLTKRVRTAKGGLRMVSEPAPGLDHPWDAIVVDEAHYIKGRSTTWTGAVLQLASKSEYAVALTGTPIPNWAQESFTLLRFLYPDKAKPGGEFGSYQRWLSRWFRLVPNYAAKNDRAVSVDGLLECGPMCKSYSPNHPCKHYQKFVESNFGSRVVRHLRDDVLNDLPALTTTEVHTRMSRGQAKAYRELRKEFLTELGDGTEVVAWSDGSLNVLLDKVTTSDWLIGPMDTEPKGGKLDRLRFDLAERVRPTLVVAFYRDTVAACAEVAKSLGKRTALIRGGMSTVQRRAVFDRFHRNEIDVLVGSIDALAEGVTLNEADCVVMVESSFRPSRNEQVIRRVHRIGQSRPVTVLDYVTPQSVDSKKRLLLKRKTDQQIRVLSSGAFARLV